MNLSMEGSIHFQMTKLKIKKNKKTKKQKTKTKAVRQRHKTDVVKQFIIYIYSVSCICYESALVLSY